MRLAKGFFLPFLAAEWLLYRCRPPTAGRPGANRPEFAEPVGDMNSSDSSSSSSSSSTSTIIGTSSSGSGGSVRYL